MLLFHVVTCMISDIRPSPIQAMTIAYPVGGNVAYLLVDHTIVERN